MRIIKKTVIIAVSIVVVIFIAITILLWLLGGELFFMAPSYNKADRYLKKNIDELSYVADALFELDYDGIEIRKNPLTWEDKYNMEVGIYKESPWRMNSEVIPIPDDLRGYIERLYNGGLHSISCGRDSVGFTLWVFMGDIRVISYSRTGEKPDGEQLIEVRQLSEKNWFYYVHNYEKAKMRNPELFQ